MKGVEVCPRAYLDDGMAFGVAGPLAAARALIEIVARRADEKVALVGCISHGPRLQYQLAPVQ